MSDPDIVRTPSGTLADTCATPGLALVRTDLPIPGAAAGVTLHTVLRARARLAPMLALSPLVRAPWLDATADAPVWLKDETRGPTGAFKIRGAISAIAALPEAARPRGVVTVSTGNHGRGVAYAAHAMGLRAVVCVSGLVPRYRHEAIRRLGGEVRVVGTTQDQAADEAARLAREEGMVLLSPFNDPRIVSGQGTIGLEIAEALPDVGTVLVGLSGGGLAGGVAAVLKAINPAVRVVGLSTDDGGAAMQRSIQAGHPVTVPEPPNLADSLGGGIDLDNQCTFALCRELLDDYVLLSEAEIAAGMRALYREQRMIGEGAGAVGPAALMARRVWNLPRPIVCVISGGIVDMDVFTAVINGADSIAAAQGETDPRKRG